MADATPRSYVYGMIIFTLVIVGGMSIYATFGHYSPAMTSSTKYIQFNQTFDKYSELNESVGNLQASITESPADLGVFGVLNGLINTAWNGLKLIFTSFGFMNNAGQGLSDVFGVPAWIPSLLLLTIIVMFAFTIWSAIFQSEL
jgi:hypothetical protein